MTLATETIKLWRNNAKSPLAKPQRTTRSISQQKPFLRLLPKSWLTGRRSRCCTPAKKP